MEEDKPQNQQFIELEGPAELAIGQNFYDYPPFKQKLEKIADETGLPLPDLRTALTVAAKFGYDRPPGDPKQKRVVKMVDTIPLDISGEEPSAKRGRVLTDALLHAKLSFKRYGQALQMMVDALKEYPGWGKYINTQRDTRDYKLDGTFKVEDPENLKTFGTKSYAQWAIDEASRVSDEELEKREKVHGMGEVLPPGYPSDSTKPPEGLIKKS